MKQASVEKKSQSFAGPLLFCSKLGMSTGAVALAFLGDVVPVALHRVPAGGLVMTARTTDAGPEDADVVVVRLDAQGAIASARKLRGATCCTYPSAVDDGSGGTLIVGTQSGASVIMNVLVVRMDAAGELAWASVLLPAASHAYEDEDAPDGGSAARRRHGDTTALSSADVFAATPDGGAVVVGSLTRGDTGAGRVLVARLDGNDGSLLWSHVLIGRHPTAYGMGGFGPTAAGDYLVAVRMREANDAEADGLLALDGASGNVTWSAVLPAAYRISGIDYSGQDDDVVRVAMQHTRTREHSLVFDIAAASGQLVENVPDAADAVMVLAHGHQTLVRPTRGRMLAVTPPGAGAATHLVERSARLELAPTAAVLAPLGSGAKLDIGDDAMVAAAGAVAGRPYAGRFGLDDDGPCAFDRVASSSLANVTFAVDPASLFPEFPRLATFPLVTDAPEVNDVRVTPLPYAFRTVDASPPAAAARTACPLAPSPSPVAPHIVTPVASPPAADAHLGHAFTEPVVLLFALLFFGSVATFAALVIRKRAARPIQVAL